MRFERGCALEHGIVLPGRVRHAYATGLRRGFRFLKSARRSSSSFAINAFRSGGRRFSNRISASCMPLVVPVVVVHGDVNTLGLAVQRTGRSSDLLQFLGAVEVVVLL